MPIPATDSSLEASILRAFPSDAHQGDVELRNHILDVLRAGRLILAEVRGTTVSTMVAAAYNRLLACLGQAPQATTLLAAYGPNHVVSIGEPAFSLPLAALRDLEATVRGASEAGYYDDAVKGVLDKLVEHLHHAKPGDPFFLHVTDEALESTGLVAELVRRAAGIADTEDLQALQKAGL